MSNAVAFIPTTWADRLRWKLFPIDGCEIPDVPAKDCVITRTKVRFSFAGRLRLLFSGRLTVETKTATENIVGNCETASCCYINAPKFMERQSTINLEGVN